MVVLRLDESVLPDGRFRMVVGLDGDGGVPSAGVSEFGFALTEADRADIRWYLEDFLEYPLDPAPAVAARVEARMVEIGTELFGKVFGSDNAREAWASVRNQLGGVRVEVGADVEGAVGLPWELLADPRTGLWVALQVGSFVRVHRGAAVRARRPVGAQKLRVLLVICRPGGRQDVPFRSVASHLVRLGGTATEVLDLRVLRPPTFGQLTTVLEAAHAAGAPFHVVHFDGHGAYLDPAVVGDGPVTGLGAARFGVVGRVEPGPHGFLLFEDPGSVHNQMLVGGTQLGALLTRTGVPVLLLNACRSAYADTPTVPSTTDPSVSDGTSTDGGGDPHRRVRAYGSLAVEVAEQGVAGVVAMRYNVYVVTAAQFVADLYTALLAGQSLGVAVSAGRRRLAADPSRAIAFTPVALQDWSVPVVYEAAPIPVLTRADTGGEARIVVSAPTADRADPGAAAGLGVDGLPHRPDVGFFGRDETLLALDRAFDKQQIVLLHAYAGSGKTSTVVEFARWYVATGGLTDPHTGFRGPVVFSSLEHHTPLARLLNDWAVPFGPLLEANGIQWDAVTDPAARRAIAVQVLAQVSVLWIWDNVEPVAGFPASTPSDWSVAEQRELADFLRDLVRTKARVLLTSRRDEHDWLGLLPTRVGLPAMPMRDMIPLTAALAARHGHRITEVEDWRPLLRYTAGNPLTVTVVVGQVLREGLTSRTQIDAFVVKLRAGETPLADDEAEGRSRSLGASLGYGFASAFTDTERARLAMLHLFQDTVDVDALVLMGNTDDSGRVPVLAGLTREAGIVLLDRAADLGLLTPYRGGYYRIHPALPWYFRHLFTTHHPESDAAVSAYTAAIAELGRHYHQQYNQGQVGVVGVLGLEEANLLHARGLARTAGRWGEVINCMQGLRTLCEHVGRWAEWSRLVEELTPDLADPVTDQPLPGRDEEWTIHTEYRVGIARRARDWPTATRLQQAILTWNEGRAGEALATPAGQLTDVHRHRIRTLAASEHATGDILFEQDDPACLEHYKRALDLSQRLDARTEEATAAFSLGHAYLDIAGLRDLDEAERWYQHAFIRFEDHDQRGSSGVTAQLGKVAYERFSEARACGEPVEIVVGYLNTAAGRYHNALDMTSADAVTDLAITHAALGTVYSQGGQPDIALTHFRQAIRHYETAGDRYGAGQTRFNVALLLANTGRTVDALAYAQAALRDHAPYGDAASTDIAKAQRLIADLEGRLARV